jgi:hypothetical protein
VERRLRLSWGLDVRVEARKAKLEIALKLDAAQDTHDEEA